MLCKDIMCEEIMGRHYLPRFIFGCGPNGLLQVISWIACYAQRKAIHELTPTKIPSQF